EQPVAAGNFAGMRQVREEGGIPVMADESLVTLEQARRLIEIEAADYFKIQVGAQVGETGILSAAGRAVAANLPALAFAEGSFGTWLLAEDLTFENVA